MRAQTILLAALLALTLGCGASQPPARSAAPPAAVAAGPGAAPAAATPATGQSQWDEVLAAARKEGKVVVDVPAEVVDQYRSAFRDFREQFGIEVEARAGSTADTAQLILRECAVGRPSLDVALGGMSETLEVYPRGCLTPLRPRLILPEVTDTSKWRGGHLTFNDPEDQYFLQLGESVYGMPLINTERLRPEELASSRDLLKPELKGKIVSYDPRRAGAGQSDATYFLGVLGPDFVGELYKGQDVTNTADHRQLAEGVARGVYLVGLGHVERGVEPLRREGLPLGVATLQDAPGYVVGGSTVLKLIKDAAHPNAATVMANWMASRDGQRTMMEIIGQPSRRTDVEVPDSVPSYRIPKDGVSYQDAYDYDYYVNKRPESGRVLLDLLGR
ncbi:MAG TPA: extracellular solute-binding protein [Chloroflexota bacterium]|jgi:iron(III) transport system substrate-binding protein